MEDCLITTCLDIKLLLDYEDSLSLQEIKLSSNQVCWGSFNYLPHLSMLINQNSKGQLQASRQRLFSRSNLPHQSKHTVKYTDCIPLPSQLLGLLREDDDSHPQVTSEKMDRINNAAIFFYKNQLMNGDCEAGLQNQYLDQS